jgi:hypothetical protein
MIDWLNSNSGGIQAIGSILSVLITIGLAGITWIYAILTNRLVKTAETQLRIQKESERASLQQDIIDRSLQFIFRINDDLNSLRASKSTYLVAKANFPNKQKEVETLNKDFLKHLQVLPDNNKMFVEIMFVSYQLQRLDDNSLWLDFEKIGNLIEKMFNVLPEDMDGYEATETVFKKYVKDFVAKCIAISSIGKIHQSDKK